MDAVWVLYTVFVISSISYSPVRGQGSRKIVLHFWVLRRPSGKALKRRNMRIFQIFATLSGGMGGWPKIKLFLHEP